jgi:hypothetical protein
MSNPIKALRNKKPFDYDPVRDKCPHVEVVNCASYEIIACVECTQRIVNDFFARNEARCAADPEKYRAACLKEIDACLARYAALNETA